MIDNKLLQFYDLRDSNVGTLLKSTLDKTRHIHALHLRIAQLIADNEAEHNKFFIFFIQPNYVPLPGKGLP